MGRIQIGTPEEQQLTAMVLEKLGELGWSDNDVLANFIVVMVANDKSKAEIISELEDILPDHSNEFVDWLFGALDGARSTPGSAAAQGTQDISMDADSPSKPQEPERQSRTHTRQVQPSRLLQSALTNVSRDDPAPTRQAPPRKYENRRSPEAQESRQARGNSMSPVRSNDRSTGRNGRGDRDDDRVRFRRNVSREERSIEDRLGSKPESDRLRGRLGRIEDRLGTLNDEHSNGSNYREDRNNRGRGNGHHSNGKGRANNNNNNNDNNGRDSSKRDIESRLGKRANDELPEQDIPKQPASWSQNPTRMLMVEASMTAETTTPRCKFWPNCDQGVSCKYWHPAEPCARYPNCPETASTCHFIHPREHNMTAEQEAAVARQALLNSMRPKQIPGFNNHSTMGHQQQQPQRAEECKFGNRCTKPDCIFRHPGRDMSQQPCRFFPNCTNPTCGFFHPPYGELLASKPDTSMGETTPTTVTAAAPSFPAATPTVPNGATALAFTRLPTPCRFADMCTRPDCHFTHPRDLLANGLTPDNVLASMPMCRFAPNCTRVGCKFRHGPSSNKTLILNKPNATSERFTNMAVDQSEVEKLHVPASSYWASGGVSHGVTAGTAPGQSVAEVDLLDDLSMSMDTEF